MKRVYLSLFILVAIVFACLFSYHSINKELSFMRDELENCMKLADSSISSEAEKKCLKVYAHWQKASKKLEFAVSEDICDEVANELESVIISITDGDFAKAKENIKRVLNTIQEINNNERISLDAVL